MKSKVKTYKVNILTGGGLRWPRLSRASGGCKLYLPNLFISVVDKTPQDTGGHQIDGKRYLRPATLEWLASEKDE